MSRAVGFAVRASAIGSIGCELLHVLPGAVAVVYKPLGLQRGVGAAVFGSEALRFRREGVLAQLRPMIRTAPHD